MTKRIYGCLICGERYSTIEKFVKRDGSKTPLHVRDLPFHKDLVQLKFDLQRAIEAFEAAAGIKIKETEE